MVVFDIGGQASLTICEPRETQRPNPGGTSGSYPIFYVEDLDRVHETLRDRGVSVETIESRGGVRWFVFTDPDGNRLEVCHYEKFGL